MLVMFAYNRTTTTASRDHYCVMDIGIIYTKYILKIYKNGANKMAGLARSNLSEKTHRKNVCKMIVKSAPRKSYTLVEQHIYCENPRDRDSTNMQYAIISRALNNAVLRHTALKHPYHPNQADRTE